MSSTAINRNDIDRCISAYFNGFVENTRIEDFVTYMVNSNNDLRFEPYYNISEKRAELLPEELIKFLNGSNGLCAGNSPEEAITQGLCEIFERYIRKEIYFNSLSSTSISEDYYFNTNMKALDYCIGLIKDFDIYIKKYLSYNSIYAYRVFVKDMSTISYWSSKRIAVILKINY